MFLRMPNHAAYQPYRDLLLLCHAKPLHIHFFALFSTHSSDFTLAAQLPQAFQRCFHNIMRVVRPQRFREDIGNELEKDNLIRVANPRPNAVVKSPLVVKGMARGTWFFEASFPVRLFNGNGEEIARGVAQAKSDWMTTEFVPFEVTLVFTMPTTTTGTLLLDKDNPSGLPENEDALRMPVHFTPVL